MSQASRISNASLGSSYFPSNQSISRSLNPINNRPSQRPNNPNHYMMSPSYTIPSSFHRSQWSNNSSNYGSFQNLNIPSSHWAQRSNNPSNYGLESFYMSSSHLTNSNIPSFREHVDYGIRSDQGHLQSQSYNILNHKLLVDHMLASEQGHGAGPLPSSSTPSFEHKVTDMIESEKAQIFYPTSYESLIGHMIRSQSGHNNPQEVGHPSPTSQKSKGKWVQGQIMKGQGHEKTLEIGQSSQTPTSLNAKGKWFEWINKQAQGHEKTLEVGQSSQTPTSQNSKGKWVEWINKQQAQGHDKPLEVGQPSEIPTSIITKGNWVV